MQSKVIPGQSTLSVFMSAPKRRRVEHVEEEEGGGEAEVPDEGDEPDEGHCKECGDDVDGSHFCDRCGAPMHAFCGTGIGEEGYGQKRRCRQCS